MSSHARQLSQTSKLVDQTLRQSKLCGTIECLNHCVGYRYIFLAQSMDIIKRMDRLICIAKGKYHFMHAQKLYRV